MKIAALSKPVASVIVKRKEIKNRYLTLSHSRILGHLSLAALLH